MTPFTISMATESADGQFLYGKTVQHRPRHGWRCNWPCGWDGMRWLHQEPVDLPLCKRCERAHRLAVEEMK